MGGDVDKLRKYAREQLGLKPWPELLANAHPHVRAVAAHSTILEAYADVLRAGLLEPKMYERHGEDNAEIGALPGDLVRLWRRLPDDVQDEVRRRAERPRGQGPGRQHERRGLLLSYLDRPGVGWWRGSPTVRELALLDVLDAEDHELADLAKLEPEDAIQRAAGWIRNWRTRQKRAETGSNARGRKPAN